MKKLLKIALNLVLAFAITAAMVCCGSDGGSDNPDPDPKPNPGKAFIKNAVVPTTMAVTAGANKSLQGSGALESDKLELKADQEYLADIVKVAANSFTFRVPEDLPSGTAEYVLTMIRDKSRQELGKSKIAVINNTNVPDKAGMTYKGKVYTKSGTKTVGVKDVLVTDGVDFTTTDADGNYWIASDKRYAVVYIVLPTGYDVPTKAALPQFWAAATQNATTCEQHNFELVANNNDNHTMIVATDIHLSGRGGSLKPTDLIQFKEGFVKDLTTDYTGAKNVYCINMGDFAWDIYWYGYNSASFYSTYGKDNHAALKGAQAQISSLPVQFWSTMGNHDNDGHTKGQTDQDLAASGPFREVVGPTHISFNIGKIHYMLLDDIVYINSYPGTEAVSSSDPNMGNRNYSAGLRADIIEWVKKDLEHVDKTTPIVCGYHIPMLNATGTGYAFYGSALTELNKFLDLFADYTEVEFMSGHSHVNRCYPLVGRSSNMYEHNWAAVCGHWWGTSGATGGTTTTLGSLNLCQDGVPAGYALYKVNGTNRTWQWKGEGVSKDKYFKAYDMNEVKKCYTTYQPAIKFFDAGECPNSAGDAPAGSKITWTRADYGMDEPQNTVWVNVWGYEGGNFASYGNCSVTAKEGSKALTVELITDTCHDPLAALESDITSFDKNGSFSSNSQSRSRIPHMFRITGASSASSTITIEYKDRFGVPHQKEFKRPSPLYKDGAIQYNLD